MTSQTRVDKQMDAPMENFSKPEIATMQSTPAACHHSAIAGYSYPELKELFSTLQPQLIETDTRLAGHITTLCGTSWMPRFLRRLLVWVLNLIFPWSGKGFFEEGGSNLWFGVKNGPRFGHYDVSIQAEGTDGKPVVWLNYDVKRNWPILRRIRGEARLLGPGIQLCRMLWKTRRGYFTVMYFTLSIDK